MRSGAIIYPLLTNYADLIALVPANKIFAIRGQQPTGGPYIVYREISLVPLDTKGDSTDTASDPRIRQRSILDTSRVQISVFADTYLEVENIAVQVRQALDREWGTVNLPYQNDISLDSCIFESAVDDYDDDYGSRGVYIKHLDFKLRINRINISNTFVNNYSLAFDGVDDYGTAGSSIAYTPNGLNTNNGFSVSFWYKKYSDDTKFIIQKAGQWYVGAYRYEYVILSRYTGQLRFVLYMNDNQNDYIQIDVTDPAPNNTWIHTVITYDLSQNQDGITIYIDGEQKTIANGQLIGLQAGTPGEVVYSPTNLEFARKGSNHAFINIDEVSIWDEILTHQEAKILFNGGNTGDPNRYPIASDNLTAYFRMGDGATYPNIPNEAPQYTGQLVMTNMVASDIVNDTPPS